MKWASFDWNGDGKIDSWDGAIEIGMINQLVDEQAREERIQILTHAIISSGLSHIENAEFAILCQENNIHMDDFQQSDIDEIQRRLNRY